MHVLSVHYVKIFFFTPFDPPLLFVTFFRVTSTTVGNSSLNLLISYFFFFFFFFFLLEIHRINLGRTCFDRVGRKSETNNIFF